MNTTKFTDLPLLISKAKASQFVLEYLSQFDAEDIDSDSVDLRFEVDDVDTGSTVSIVDECGHAAESIRALVKALESAQRKIAELESRVVTVRLPVTFWYEHDDLSRDVAVLDKRLVKKAIRDACERAGIKCEVKGE